MTDYRKADFWTKKAQKENYPARSVYKLQEMQEQFKVFPLNGRILDLGAAPGSWTAFILRALRPDAHLTAVDLKALDSAISDSRLSFFQGDMGSQEIIRQVKNEGPYNAVVCDAAPATTGHKTVDTARSEALVELALYYAQTQLLKGGNTVIKIFQGGMQGEYLKQMRAYFNTARAFKPKACRASSFETYLIGLGFKG